MIFIITKACRKNNYCFFNGLLYWCEKQELEMGSTPGSYKKHTMPMHDVFLSGKR